MTLSDNTAPKAVQMANPASQYCIDQGGKLRIENQTAGQVGICQLPNGTEVEEWALFRSQQPNAAKASAPTAKVNVVAYRCARGESVRVTYFIDQERALLERNGTTIELQQKPSGSGIIYSNGPNTIRGKGKDLTLEIGRMAPIQCHAD